MWMHVKIQFLHTHTHTYFIKSLKIQFCENFFCQWQKKLVSSNITRTSLKVILGNLTSANGKKKYESFKWNYNSNLWHSNQVFAQKVDFWAKKKCNFFQI